MDRKTLAVGILLTLALIATIAMVFEHSFVWKNIPIENTDPEEAGDSL